MDAHIRLLRKEELLLDHGGWFDEDNAERVVTWLVAAEDRRPVVLVGAGFSLNARDLQTGTAATRQQAPMWSDVVVRLAADMKVPSEKYDAPTLFELYAELLRETKLRDALRDCFADAALVPGRAHKMLAAYPCEAIVTTNCLDTLLDRVCTTGWRRIVEDADLSKQGQLRDLIYLHGHRDYADSWIMTRSQYEDFHRTRPVMVARTRQLLAQHPWLVVGFGMSDPNFHSLTRLLGKEMQGHQPLSLVLMPDLPHPAERQHWRRLGFEIATPKHAGHDLGEFFAWAFQKLATHYLPTSDAAKDYIKRGETSVERLRRFRTVNPVPIVDRKIVYAEWETQLKRVLASDELTKAEDAAQAAVRAMFDSRVRMPEVVVTTGSPYAIATSSFTVPAFSNALLNDLAGEPSLKEIAGDKIVQCLDRLLQLDQNVRKELAEHFAWALQQRLFEESRLRSSVMEVVAVYLIKQAAFSDDRIEGLVHLAFASVRKYQEHDAEPVLRKYVTQFGVSVPSADEGPHERHLVDAQGGYHALMNGDFSSASKLYNRAAKQAAAADLDFEAWAYTEGAADAVRHLPESSERDVEEEEEALRARADDLAARPVVKRWLERADGRLQDMLQQTIKEARFRDENRRTGDKTMSSSSAANLLWRVYRDLFSIHAPPSLQRRYLEPLASLLDASEMPTVIATLSKPQEWLAELLRSAPSNLTEREKRDESVIHTVLFDTGSVLTKSEIWTCLACAAQLASAFRVGDISRALQWLESMCKPPLESWDSTGRATWSAVDTFWSAYSSIAIWADASAALDVARVLVDRLGHKGADGDVRALCRLPWSRWRLAEGDTARGFVELLTGRLRRLDEDGGWRHRRVAYAFAALLQMIRAGLDQTIVRPHVERWQELLSEVKTRGDVATRRSEAREGFQLERVLQGVGLAPSKSVSELFRSWCEPSEKPGGMDELDAHEALWEVLGEAVDAEPNAANELRDRLASEAQRIAGDARLLKRYDLNPHLASSALGVLGRALKLVPALRSVVVPALLQFIAAVPDQLSALSGVIDPGLWDSKSWNALKNQLVINCGNAIRTSDRHREDPGLGTRCQADVLMMIGSLDVAKLQSAEPALWYTLQGFALASVNDERLAVAYAAAFAVMKIAASATEVPDAALLVSAIRRIADDPRAQVRSAVARDGVVLAARAGHHLVRDAAQAAITELKRDSNAQVACLLAASEREECRVNPPSPAFTQHGSGPGTAAAPQ